MRYKHILVTGGAGFIGSTICIKLKEYYPSLTVFALDNLKRRGSELNLPRLKSHGVQFIHGDIRNMEDITINSMDLLIECSAEPSIMAGVTSSPEYIVQTNLVGAFNCFELARKKEADVVFLSTSRVYPIEAINNLLFSAKKTRYEIADKQTTRGASKKGISEDFPLVGVRSLYGTTKLAAELLLQEYRANYKMKIIIDRFGVVSGPWQMGKVDQGVVALWLARHMFQKPLAYIGYGGSGKQVRDVLHVDDVFNCINTQLKHMQKANGKIYNVGGGLTNSVSLLELTNYCQQITNKKIAIKKISKTRRGDIKSYISDSSKIFQDLGWKPQKNIVDILQDTHTWILENQEYLENILE